MLADLVYRQAAAASASALAHSAALRRDEVRANRTIAIGVGIALLLVAFFGAVVVRYGRRIDAAVAAEVERLAEMAITDPLTGLRNHRAFHEDVARELQRVGRTGVPLALVLLDLDDLKAVNDTHGHQAGDERLQALADAIRATGRGADLAYRVGGDEFAVILPDARAWGALEFAQRLRAATQAGDARRRALHHDGRHLRGARAALQGRAHPRGRPGPHRRQAHPPGRRHLRPRPRLRAPTATRRRTSTTRARSPARSARAVDAKDSYTRSHCQTVSQLCGADRRRARLRRRAARRACAWPGLLHDVGKIGVPDAILNKPAKLTDDEYEHMKRHSLLGYDIVQAADMELEARWVRHHHERFDGGGYPDGLRRRGDPARVARHPRRRRLRGDDLRPALPPRARAVLRDRASSAATPARSSTRPSSRPSPACSPAPARSADAPVRARSAA